MSFTVDKKKKSYEKVQRYLDQYRQVVLCEIKDLPADMIHKIRKLVRNINSEVVCGKTVSLIFNITFLFKLFFFLFKKIQILLEIHTQNTYFY